MRKAFISELTAIARDDQRVVLLTADLGWSVIEPFAEAHPNRFFNVGAAEQNMVGMAIGLAEAGLLPFCYSIASFAVYRPFEMIKSAVQHALPVRMVGVGRDDEYAKDGPTHWSFGVREALLSLRESGDPNDAGPHFIAPVDDDHAVDWLRATYDHPGVMYYHLSKNAVPAV